MNQSGEARDLPATTTFQPDDGASFASEQRAVTGPINVLAVIGSITSQAVLITALLYYFGWVYTHNFFRYFGIDISLLDYSTTDYVLRSINVAFQPFAYLALAAFLLLGFHRLMVLPALMKTTPGLPRSSEATISDSSGSIMVPRSAWQSLNHTVGLKIRRRAQALGCGRPGSSGIRWIIGVIQAAALAFMALAFVGILFLDTFGAPLGLFLPVSLMLGSSLLGYVAYMRSTYPDTLAVTVPPQHSAISRAYAVTLLALGLIGGLWAVASYGEDVGTRSAAGFAAQLLVQPGVVIYSIDRIALNGTGIDVNEITQAGAKYHYQYTGLRLLVRSQDRFLLVPSQWQLGRDRVFLLRDDDSIRVDVTVR